MSRTPTPPSTPPFRLKVLSKTGTQHAAEGNQSAFQLVQIRFKAPGQSDTLLVCFHSEDSVVFPAHEQFEVGKTYCLVPEPA